MTRASQRRRLEENNPHPSQLTAHSAARENLQSSTGANLGTTRAAAVQKRLQEAGIVVNNPQSASQPDIQFIPDTPQSNSMGSRQQDGSLLTQTPAQATKMPRKSQVKKNVTCQGTKVPRVSLFNIIRNKELLAYSGDEYFVLADVVDSLGCKLLRNEKLSDVSCLTCARTLARIYGTFKKITARVNDGVVNTARARRIPRNSPTGISPAAKRSREHFSTSPVSSRSPRRSLVLSDVNRENQNPLAGVCALEDGMISAMDLGSDVSVQPIMKVTNSYLLSFACLIL